MEKLCSGWKSVGSELSYSARQTGQPFYQLPQPNLYFATNFSIPKQSVEDDLSENTGNEGSEMNVIAFHGKSLLQAI